MITLLAPAKVNLHLHVGAPGPDGLHPVCSLAAFADVGDELSIAAASETRLVLEGPGAAALWNEDPQSNLAVRAARAFLEGDGGPGGGAVIRLSKHLPTAAGLGGGSADAGATLRALARLHPGHAAPQRLERIARQLGADGPLCLWSRPAVATGIGDVLRFQPLGRKLHAVLVNCGVKSETGAVYRAYDVGPFGGADAPALAPGPDADLIEALKSTRNDLEAPAIRLNPEIGETMSWLAAAPQARLTRMSGSGATVFCLCGDAAGAAALLRRVRRERPRWWSVATRLGDSPAEAFP